MGLDITGLRGFIFDLAEVDQALIDLAALQVNSRGKAPANVIAENFAPAECTTDHAATASQTVFAGAIFLEKGQKVSKLSLFVGATAAGTPTHEQAGLYSADGLTQLAVSADGTSTAMPLKAVFDFTMATAYTVTASGLYKAAFLVTATTPPSLYGAAAMVDASVDSATTPAEFATHDTGVNALPASLAAATAVTKRPWIGVK